MEFEWDVDKAEDNLDKHGVSFDEAREVFDDADVLHVFDESHSEAEDRFVAIGVTQGLRLVAVAYTMRAETVRIISARPATRRERRLYAAGE